MTDHFFNPTRNLSGNIHSSRRTFLKQSAISGISIASGLSITAQALAKSPLGQSEFSQNKITANPIGFNGERQDPITKQYHLGNGVRMYNPSLMRFHAKDSMSPFGKGGINSYAYCLGDPVNRRDPSGHFAILSLLIGMIVGAIIGASIAAAAEGVKASVTGTAFDWKQVAIGAALGAIGGGFGAAAQGASFGVKLGLAIADALVSGIADFSLNAAAGEPTKNAAQSAAIGAVIGLVTFGVGAGVSKSNTLNRLLGKNKSVRLEDGSISMGSFKLYKAKHNETSSLLVIAHGKSNGDYYKNQYKTSYLCPHGRTLPSLGVDLFAKHKFEFLETFKPKELLHNYKLGNYSEENSLLFPSAFEHKIDILTVSENKLSSTLALEQTLKKHSFDYSNIEMVFCRRTLSSPSSYYPMTAL